MQKEERREDRLYGVVVGLEICDRANREPRRDQAGNAILRHHIRRVFKNNKGDDVSEDYDLSSEDPATPGLAMFHEKQGVSFCVEGGFARDIERVPSKELPEWKHYAEQIKRQNQTSQNTWMEALVISYNPLHGFGFAQLETNGQKIYFNQSAVVKRDKDDLIGFFAGDPVHVYLRPARHGEVAAKGRNLCPTAAHVICME